MDTPMRAAFTLLATCLLAAPAGAGQYFGEPVERAAAVHLTAAGLEHIGDALEGLVPTSFPVEDISGEVYCSEEDAQPLVYELAELNVTISADDVQIVASEGRLDLTLYGTLGSSASTFYVAGDCSVLTDLDEACQLELPTTALSAHLGLQISEDAGVFDVLVDELEVAISPIGNPLSDCTLASVIGTLLGQDPEAISNLLLSFIEPELVDLGPTIEEALEDGLNGLSFDTELALGEFPMQLYLYPTRVEFGDNGVILGLGATIDAEGTSACVDALDGSPFSDDEWPELATTAPGTDLEYDAGVVLSRDFIDHLLWGLWASGGLCIELSDLAGADLQTSLLESFFGDSFAALFPEAQPATISVRPEGQPLAIFSHDEPPLAVAIEDLGLNLLVSLDQREARIFRVGVDAEVGVSVEVDSDAITPVLYLDPATFSYHETYNDLLSEGFSDNFTELVEMVIGMFLPDDLITPYGLPDLYGIGVGAVFWIPTEDDAWQGMYLLVDSSEVQPLDIGGCSGGSLGCGEGDTGTVGIDLGELGCDDKSGGCGGCDDKSSGCSDKGGGCGGSSCSSSSELRLPATVPWRSLLLLAVAGAVVLRRRRE